MAAVGGAAMAGAGMAVADIEATYAANTMVQAAEANAKIKTLAQKFCVDSLIV